MHESPHHMRSHPRSSHRGRVIVPHFSVCTAVVCVVAHHAQVLARQRLVSAGQFDEQRECCHAARIRLAPRPKRGVLARRSTLAIHGTTATVLARVCVCPRRLLVVWCGRGCAALPAASALRRRHRSPKVAAVVGPRRRPVGGRAARGIGEQAAAVHEPKQAQRSRAGVGRRVGTPEVPQRAEEPDQAVVHADGVERLGGSMLQQRVTTLLEQHAPCDSDVGHNDVAAAQVRLLRVSV